MLAQYDLARRSFLLSHPSEPVPAEILPLDDGWTRDWYDVHSEQEQTEQERRAAQSERSDALMLSILSRR